MYENNPLLFFLIDYCIQTYAQSLHIIQSDEIEYEKPYEKSTTLHDNSGNYYLVNMQLKRPANQYRVDVFNSELGVTNSFIEELASGEKELKPDTVFLIGGKINIFSVDHDVKYDDGALYRHVVDVSSGKSVTDGVPVINFEKEVYGKYHAYYILQSDDKSLLAVVSFPPATKIQTNMHVKVFDGAFNIVWQNKIIIPFAENMFQSPQFTLSNSGNLFFSAEVFNKKMSLANDPENSGINLFSITEEGTIFKNIDLKRSKINAVYLKYTINKEENFVCYLTGTSMENLKDRFSMITVVNSSSGDILSAGTYEPSLEIIEKGNVSQSGKLGVVYSLFIPEKIMVEDDGSIYCLAQQHAYGGTGIDYVHSYYSILAVKFNDHLEMQWEHIVPRNETCYSSDLRAYFINCFVSKDHFNIVYALDEEAINAETYKEIKKSSGYRATMLARVDDAGTIERKVLMQASKEEPFYAYLDALALDNNKNVYMNMGRITNNSISKVIILKK